MRPNEDRALERAKEAFLREVRKYPWFDITANEEGGLACVCVTFGDHSAETDLPYSPEGVKAFTHEEARRTYWKLSNQYRNRAQNICK